MSLASGLYTVNLSNTVSSKLSLFVIGVDEIYSTRQLILRQWLPHYTISLSFLSLCGSWRQGGGWSQFQIRKISVVVSFTYSYSITRTVTMISLLLKSL